MQLVRWLVGLGWAAWVGVGACAQGIDLGEGSVRTATRQYVVLETDAVQVAAGRPAWVELRFRVEAGKHINSHTPHSDLLVGTALQLGAAEGPKVEAEEYPAGVPLRLDVGAGEVLSTYQGEFAVRVNVVAGKGDAVLAGVLRYQACDARSCFPPRSLPVRVALTAR